VKAYEESAKDFQVQRDRIANEAQNARDSYDQLQLLEKVLPFVKSGFGSTTMAALDDAARQYLKDHPGEIATWRQIADS